MKRKNTINKILQTDIAAADQTLGTPVACRLERCEVCGRVFDADLEGVKGKNCRYICKNCKNYAKH